MIKNKKKLVVFFLSIIFLSCSSLKRNYRYGKIEKIKYIEEIEYDKTIFFGGSDKLQPINRRIYYFNGFFDKNISRPVIKVYDFIIPKFFKDRIRNFFSNFKNITSLLNEILQMKFYDGAETTFRFLINTTIGIGGVFDPATKMGLEKHSETLGRTLAYYGFGAGPYIVSPFLGPTNFRDLTSLGISLYGLKEVHLYDNYLGLNLTNLYAITLMGIDEKERLGIYFMATDYVFEYEYFRYLNKKYLDVLDRKNKYYVKGK